MGDIETGEPQWQAVCVDDGPTKRWVISTVAELPRQRSTDATADIPRQRLPAPGETQPQRRAPVTAAPPATRARPARTAPSSHRRDSALSAYVAAATAPQHRNKLLLVGGLLSLSVAAAGAAVVATAPAGAAAAGITLYGTFRLNPSTTSGLANYAQTSPGSCSGAGRYQGISAGAAVTIVDQLGRAVATGVLGAGREVGGGGCAFTWRISKVPKEASYGVGIASLGTVRFARSHPAGGFNTAVGS